MYNKLLTSDTGVCVSWETLGKMLYEELKAKKLSHHEMYPNPEAGCFEMIISGDWKHDHLRAKLVVKEFFKSNGFEILGVQSQEIGHSDCDWYTAQHTFYLPGRYIVREV